MRFSELSLERYGQFDNCRLSLRQGSPDFHIIYGPNEAGKSTTLTAVSDLLFGIPQRSPYNFQYEYPLMRIGAVLEADGNRFACRRRKTREKSLVDAQDQPLDESQLLAMLHGLSRETFASGHSLDQASLRRGGEAMVKANDDLGQALFAAGSGLTGIAGIQAALDKEVDEIWGKRAAQRRSFTVAETQFDNSMRIVRDQQLRPKEWAEARAALTRREEELNVLKQQQAELSQSRRTAERLRRISPAARQRAALLIEIADLARVIAFSQQEENQLEGTLARFAKAASEREIAEKFRDDAAGRLALLSPDAIVSFAGQIEALIERRGAIGKAETDRTRLSIERKGLEDSAAVLRAEIGAEGDIPSRLVMARLRAVTSQYAEAKTSLRTHEESLADLQGRAEPLREQLIDAPLAEGLAGLRAAIALGRGLGEDFDARCAARLAAADRARAEADTTMAQLAPWLGSVEDLARLGVIDEPEIQAASEAGLRLAGKVEEGCAEQRRLEEELQRLAVEAGRLAETGQAVSADELAGKRAARDTIWHDIETHLRGTQPLPDIPETAQAFGAATAAADAVADRRYDTAEASARLTALANARAERDLLLQQAEGRAAAAEQALDAARRAWADRLAVAGLPALEPVRLRGWYGLRKTALEQHRLAIEAHQQAARDAERRTESIQLLVAAMAVPPVTAERLSLVLAAADRERAEGEVLEQAFAEKRNKLAGFDDEIVRLQRRIEQDRRGVDGARREWEAEQSGLGIRFDLGDVEGRLSLIDQLRGEFDAMRDREQRIRGIDGDRESFDADVIALAGHVGLETDAAPSQLLDVMRARLTEGRSIAQKIASATDERDRRQDEVDAATIAGEVARTALAPFLMRAGLDDVAALPAILERSRYRRGLAVRLLQAEQAIIADGDGYALVDLVAAWEAVDPDEMASRVQALDQDLTGVHEQVSATANALGEARRTFAALDERPHTAVDAAADAEAARAEMAVQAEIYILKRSQSLMLRWAMERYRERRQGPLLRRASELFNILTLGRFVELKVDYEPATPRLLGLRQDGATLVPIDGMSEGTTDQLFLALRLAALEQSIANGIRVPFLADDLFVNFDDARAEAGLGILAEIAKSTQVLFFTHHAHLRDIAQRVVGAEHSFRMHAFVVPGRTGNEARIPESLSGSVRREHAQCRPGSPNRAIRCCPLLACHR